MSNPIDRSPFWRVFLHRFLLGLGIITLLLIGFSLYVNWSPRKAPPRIGAAIIDEHGNVTWSNPPSTALEKAEQLAQSVKQAVVTNFQKPKITDWDVLRTNKVLKEMSATNAAFQQWGAAFMLGKANDFLAKVPVYGLQGPLAPSQVICTSYLTYSGAELWLTTTDKSHSMHYEHGVLDQINALKADMTGIGHFPEKLETFGKDLAPWSNEQAERKALEILAKLGISRWEQEITGKPKVEASTFKDAKYPSFYTVEFTGGLGLGDIEIRFRHAQGQWLLTSWFNNWRKSPETESRDMPGLYARFFAQ